MSDLFDSTPGDSTPTRSASTAKERTSTKRKKANREIATPHTELDLFATLVEGAEPALSEPTLSAPTPAEPALPPEPPDAFDPDAALYDAEPWEESTEFEVAEAAPAASSTATPLAPTPEPPPGPIADADQRHLIRTALDATLVVEASAGTGKTTELVARMVALLESGGARLDTMVALTFTDAAAGELKLRLREAIERARLDTTRPAATRQRLEHGLPKLEEARIGTIHSFCVDLLRERPVEAGVDPRFAVAPDDTAKALFERVFSRWFESQLQDPGPGVRRIMRRWKREPMFGRRRRDEGPRGLLRMAAWSLVEHRDFPTPWRRDDGFDRDPEIDALIEEMTALGAWAEKGEDNDWFTKSLAEIDKFAAEVRRSERIRERDYDALEARLSTFEKAKHWGWKGWARGGRSEFPRAELRERRDALYARLGAFAVRAGADLAPLLRDELWPIVGAYEAAKARAGCLDFDDLLIRARDLVRGNVEIRRELQRRFTHYFVDEFQDTDPLQAEILMLLAADDARVEDWRAARVVPGKLFLVGDPKQSIYRFRRADVALYRDVQRRLREQGATIVRLTVSFRSVPEIQQAVNAAFASRLGGDAKAGHAYVPLAPFRRGAPSQPAVVALPVPQPYGDFRKVVDWKIEDSLPDVVAAWIDWLVRSSGWTVTERERPGVRVPVESRHVCVLFRRFKSFGQDMTREYVAALEARQLPHLLVGGSSFHEREEIEALRNALVAIERPDDELAVFATLRGPLIALPDTALLAWRHALRPGSTRDSWTLHPFSAEPEHLSEALAEVAEAMRLLRELHRERNRRPVADTIVQLLEITRAPAAFANWPTGPQALANVSRLLDMARRAEQQGLLSFRAFVDRLEDDADRGEAAEAPLLEEGVEGVRIMTVHKAKGLEFPVVVLADMTANETLEQALRWSDPARGLSVQRIAQVSPPELVEHNDEEMEREREEAVRVLYVAATRARDILVVPVIGDERRDGWLAALHPAVHPEPMRARRPISREPIGCPRFGEDSVPHRPQNVDRPLASVAPGEHVPEAGEHRVIWWDPASLELGARASIGLTQTRILEADDSGRATAALGAWEKWAAERASVREQGSVPTRRVRRATDRVPADDQAEAADIHVVYVDTRIERPGGRRFGDLVHAVLAVVDLDGNRDVVEGHAEVMARLLGALPQERDAAVEVVVGALAHRLVRAAAKAAREGQCRREARLLVRHAGGELIEGIVDLAFLADGAWTVVDFKTTKELGAAEATYRRQVALYVEGITEATGKPATGYVLGV